MGNEVEEPKMAFIAEVRPSSCLLVSRRPELTWRWYGV